MARINIEIFRESDSDTRICYPADVLAALANNGKLGWFDENQLGNCYEVAGNLLITLAEEGLSDSWFYVQGTLAETGIHHAWLESDGWVIDFSSSKQMIIDKDAFNKKAMPSEDRVAMTFVEFSDAMLSEEGRKQLGTFSEESEKSLTDIGN